MTTTTITIAITHENSAELAAWLLRELLAPDSRESELGPWVSNRVEALLTGAEDENGKDLAGDIAVVEIGGLVTLD